MINEQAIAPTIVWALLTGLASSRRRRSAGEEVKKKWRDQYSLYYIQERDLEYERQYFKSWAQALRRFRHQMTSLIILTNLIKLSSQEQVGSLFITSHSKDYFTGGLGEEAAERQELSRYPTSHRRVYWAGEKASTQLYYNFVLRDRNFQEPLGKPGKKRAALAHFDTIFSLDKIMVQLTIQAVLVSRRIIYRWASFWTRDVNIHQTMTNHTK